MSETSLHRMVLAEARRRLATLGDDATDRQVAAVLVSTTRLLANYRSKLVGWRYLQREAPVVRAGPFAGLVLLPRTIEGAVLPKLLGSYEHELHAIIEAICRTEYGTIVNIGCADGYYAVGFARRMAAVAVIAVDIDQRARETCELLAEVNGVRDRVRVIDALSPEGLDQVIAQSLTAGRRCLVVCDAEGVEDDLLRPEACPSLEQCDILVELHPSVRPGVVDRVQLRFQDTHHVTRIPCGTASPRVAYPPMLVRYDEIDRLLALWEWRADETPWAWMTERSADASG
jgi:hypothetical protein